MGTSILRRLSPRTSFAIGIATVAIGATQLVACASAPASPADSVERFVASLGRGDLAGAAAYVDPDRVDPTDPNEMYGLVLGHIPGVLPDRFSVSVRMAGTPETNIDGEMATVSFSAATSVDYDGATLSPSIVADFHLRRVDDRWLITDSSIQ